MIEEQDDVIMKKFRAGLLCLAAAGLLTGCSGTSTLIKSYTDTALNSKSLIISMSDDDGYDFFAEDLVVFPKTQILSAAAEPIKMKRKHRIEVKVKKQMKKMKKPAPKTLKQRMKFQTQRLKTRILMRKPG